MYFATQTRNGRRLSGLGNGFPDWTIDPIGAIGRSLIAPVKGAATYYYGVATGQPVTPPPPQNAPAPAAPSDPGTSIFIPNSSFTDILQNAITGKPTSAQIFSNTGSPYLDCVSAIGRMRQMAPGTVPAGAEAQCATDINAYLKLIGGTADKQTSTTLWAWVILFGVVGTVYLMTR